MRAEKIQHPRVPGPRAYLKSHLYEMGKSGFPRPDPGAYVEADLTDGADPRAVYRCPDLTAGMPHEAGPQGAT